MAASSVVSSKGQIVIPAPLRRELGLKPGTRLFFAREGSKLVIESDSLEKVLALCGKYKGLPLEEDLREFKADEERRLQAKYEDLRS